MRNDDERDGLRPWETPNPMQLVVSWHGVDHYVAQPGSVARFDQPLEHRVADAAAEYARRSDALTLARRARNAVTCEKSPPGGGNFDRCVLTIDTPTVCSSCARREELNVAAMQAKREYTIARRRARHVARQLVERRRARVVIDVTADIRRGLDAMRKGAESAGVVLEEAAARGELVPPDAPGLYRKPDGEA